MSRRGRVCRKCVLATLAGMSWPLWGSRPEGWPRMVLCQPCTAARRG